MNDYVVSPWFIYFYDLYGKLNIFISAFLVFSVFSLILFLILSFKYNFAKQIKLFSIITVILIMLNIFLPSKNVLLGIYATKYFTISKLETIYDKSKEIGRDFKEFTLDYLKDIIAIIQHPKQQTDERSNQNETKKK